MKLRFVSLPEDGCSDCRDELLADLRVRALPLPRERIFPVPEYWLTRNCAHGREGLRFSEPHDPERDADVLSERAKERDVEIDDPERWNNLDATKGFGYYARENGRFGSHPSHDRFDGDSDP